MLLKCSWDIWVLGAGVLDTHCQVRCSAGLVLVGATTNGLIGMRNLWFQHQSFIVTDRDYETLM
jgi:hypothetical protein